MARILYCEDNLKWSEVWQPYFSAYGYEVQCIAQTEAVLERLGKEHYDLLICNANKGTVSGFGLCEAVRAHRDRRVSRRPILMIGPEPLDHDEYKILRKDNVHYMPKYKGPEKWFQKIASILGAAKTAGKDGP